MPGAASQLSVAAAPELLTIAMHVTVISAGAVTTGAVVSTMVIVWTQAEALPQLSTELQFREMTDSSAQVPAAMLSL